MVSTQTGRLSVKFPIRWQLLFIILPISVIPLLILVISITGRVYSHLEEQSYRYYSIVLNQIAFNIDFLYDQYALTLVNIYDMSRVRAGLNAPPYRSMNEEEKVSMMITGDVISGGGLREIAREKLDGALFLYELDRSSLVDDTPYKLHYGVDTNMYIPPPLFDKMIEDPLFTTIRDDNSIKMIFGRFAEGVVPGFQGDRKPVVIFPYYDEPPLKESDTFEKFILVLLNADFLPRFYKEIDDINPGTLFILDRFNNVISRNHPGSDDYYKFDEESGEYQLDDDPASDPDEILTFKDYQQLLIDDSVFQSPVVQNRLSRNSSNILDNRENERLHIKWKGRNYLTIIAEAPNAACNLVFFLPVQQIYKPIYSIIYIILIITAAVILIVTLISILISKNFTEPVKKMADAAHHLADGQYGVQINIKTHNELGLLAAILNNMSLEIQERTRELKEANLRLDNMNKVKSLFFHSISHQLRTPVSQIVGFNNLLLNKNYDPMLDLADINEEMLSIINQIDKSSSGPIHSACELMKTFKKDIFGKNRSFFDFYRMNMDQCLQRLPADYADKIRVLLDEAAQLYQESIDKKRAVYLKINRAGENLTHLLESVSKISLFDAYVSDSQNTTCQVRTVFPKLCDAAAVMIDKKDKAGKIHVKLEINPSVPDYLVFDEFRVATVIENLFSNAVAYSSSGEIVLQVTTVNQDGKLNMRCVVSDQGIGIKQEDFEKIFVEFGKTSDSMNTESPGLGLALSRKIAQMMHGSLSVESEYGKGSTFTLTIPVQEAING